MPETREQYRQDAPETYDDTPVKEGVGEEGWDTPGREQPPAGAQPQHPRIPDAERAEGAADRVVREHRTNAPETADDTPVKADVGEDGWATQSGALDDDGALGQD